MTPATSDSRPLRADAERNRAAIIAAAARLLARDGLGVALDDVAVEAGVGSATVYRRYATSSDLAAVVLERAMAEYADRTEAAAARAEHEPWEALAEYVELVARQQVEDRAFAQVIASPRSGSTLFRRDLRRAYTSSQVLVDRVVAAGVVRADLHHNDLLMLVQSVNGLVQADRRTAVQAWPRLVATFLAAWRAGGDPLPQVPARWERGGGRRA